LFAHPDSEAIESLDQRGDYLNLRSATKWDLFFPGYYRSSENDGLESHLGSRRVGRRFTGDWFFSPPDFNRFREQIEQASAGRWRYSGEADLVLINAYMPERGAPTVDWESTISGCITDTSTGRTLSLSQIVEGISQDLEAGTGAADYGVGRVVNSPAEPATASAGREIVVSIVGEIAGALASRGLHIT